MALRFEEDFAVTGVVGPFVVLSSRDALGTAIAAADLDLGALTRNSGEQSYAVPDGGDAGRRWAWVFCRPFGVEIARARLDEVP